MNDEQLLRYSRHILLPDVDIQGQQAFLNATVMILGLGGLGSPVAMYLAASGIGRLILADYDCVDEGNLQRQIVHQQSSLGQNKVHSAVQSLQALNPAVVCECVEQAMDRESMTQWVQQADVVVDCSDNFPTRFTLNQCCVEQKTPLVSAAAIRFEGQLTVFDPRQAHSPCYNCLYTEVDDNLNCSESGVLAPLVGVMGSMQALEVLKLIGGFGETLVGRLLLFDAKASNWREFKLSRDPQCRTCGLG